MATKLGKSAYPAKHTENDFQCFGPPAVKDGEFESTMVCDMGCFSQAGVDSNKYYCAQVVQSRKDQKWYAYFEWGRQGASKPQFQFVECLSKSEAEHEYAKQLHEKNDKRGQWVNHATLGKVLQAKPGKDCYLVRPQATRSTGLPDARTIKHEVAVAKKPTAAAKKSKIQIDTQTLKLMHDLNVATVAYTRGSMADASLPTLNAINEGRDILTAALQRLRLVGDDLANQVADKEIVILTNTIYSRIPKIKVRNAKAETWILSKNNIAAWMQDLDAFESALAAIESDSVDEETDPFNGMKIQMGWVSPQSEYGEFIRAWLPNATRNMHGLSKMKIRNVWSVEREGEQSNLEKAQLATKISGRIKDKPLHQPSSRPDLDDKQHKQYDDTNTALLVHGSRSVNVSGLLREGFRFPKELVNVSIAGNMFSGGAGGIYFADDIGKSAGYTSLRQGYYSSGGGAVKGRDAFMLVCDVVLGIPHVAPASHPYTKYPDGTHSIFGKAGHSKLNQYGSGTLKNNEFIVLKKNQSRLRYLIEFDM